MFLLDRSLSIIKAVLEVLDLLSVSSMDNSNLEWSLRYTAGTGDQVNTAAKTRPENILSNDRQAILQLTGFASLV